MQSYHKFKFWGVKSSMDLLVWGDKASCTKFVTKTVPAWCRWYHFTSSASVSSLYKFHYSQKLLYWHWWICCWVTTLLICWFLGKSLKLRSHIYIASETICDAKSVEIVTQYLWFTTIRQILWSIMTSAHPSLTLSHGCLRSSQTKRGKV